MPRTNHVAPLRAADVHRSWASSPTAKATAVVPVATRGPTTLLETSSTRSVCSRRAIRLLPQSVIRSAKLNAA
jgi:hypothetical protein